MEIGQRVGQDKGVCLEHIGVLSETKSGWKTEVNIISWYEKEGKVDIRNWSPDYTKSSNKSTFTDEECEKLTGLLSERLRGNV